MMNAAANTAEKIVGHRDIPMTPGDGGDTTEMMHALVWHGKKDMRYELVPKPKLLDPEDVIVRITSTTICGSDLHIYTGDLLNVHPGSVIGHECMGIVEQVAPQVRDLKVGDRVVVAFNVSCGKCDFCHRQEFTGCPNTNNSKLMEKLFGHATGGMHGYGNLLGGYSGGQSEYIRVPFADTNCLKVPPNVPDEKALFISDISCTSYHAAIELGKVKEGDTVAIWGAGPIGALSAKWCELAGARLIIVIDNVPDRLNIVKSKIRNVETLNFDEVDVKKAIETLCPGGTDVGIEAAGFRYAKSKLHKIERMLGLETDTSEIVNEVIACVRKFGRMVLIADYTGPTNHFNIGAMMEKHLFVSGGQATVQKHWNMVLDRIQDGSFDPTIVVTHYGRLSDGPELYDKFNPKLMVWSKFFCSLEGCQRQEFLISFPCLFEEE